MQKHLKHRLQIAAIVGSCVVVGIGLILYGLRQGIVFFHTPTEVLQQTTSSPRPIRVGGLVLTESIRFAGEDVYFTITDEKAMIPVIYRGSVPALFRAGQGVVAEGQWQPQMGIFKATRLLVKHDETYRPPKPGEKVKQYLVK